MATIAEQNSAVVLSLWHCLLPRLYADIATNQVKGKEWMEDRAHSDAMVRIYMGMRELRLAVHGQSLSRSHVFNTTKLVNFMVASLPSEVWAKELHSLIQDLQVMNTILMDYNKQRLDATTGLDDDESKFHVVQVEKQPKETICLLTLWYWLAVWSTPDVNQQSEKYSAQHKFLVNIDSHAGMLGEILTDPLSSNSDNSGIQHCYFLLLEMLKSDAQHWTNVLDHFLDRMVDAGLLRGQVKEVLHAGGAIHGGATHLVATAGAPPAFQGAPTIKKSLMVKMSSKIGGLLKEGFKQLAISAVLDKLIEVVLHNYDNIKHLVEDFGTKVGSALEDFSHHAIEIAKKVVHKVGEIPGKVHDGVKKLAHIIGDGFHYVADKIQTAYHGVAHFFSHLF